MAFDWQAKPRPKTVIKGYLNVLQEIILFQFDLFIVSNILWRHKTNGRTNETAATCTGQSDLCRHRVQFKNILFHYCTARQCLLVVLYNQSNSYPRI